MASSDGDPASEVLVSLDESALSRALDTLGSRERRILELRFGFGGQEPVSLAEVGKELGLTRERVRQLERSALEQLSRNRELLEELAA